MAETADPLVLDFVEWIAREPRKRPPLTWCSLCGELHAIASKFGSQLKTRQQDRNAP